MVTREEEGEGLNEEFGVNRHVLLLYIYIYIHIYIYNT